MRIVVLIALLIGLPSCGPMFVPMTPRLNPDEQHTVDGMWDNILTPVHRVDRETLLDTNVGFWMYTYGVDRLHMTSEKYFSGGIVVMEIDCDRANPDTDQFTITVLDERGRTTRRERYTPAEVENSFRMLNGPVTQPSTQSTTTRPLTPQEQAFKVESERRRAAAVAATQPAHLGR